jgi:transposase
VARVALERGINTNLLFKWRRLYRAGEYGPPDPRHLAVPNSRPLSVSRRAPATATSVRLLPVELSAPLDVMAPNGAIEVVFRDATVRISGSPQAATLRLVLDTLARFS